MTHTTTQGHCPTPQNSPTCLPMNAVAATPAKPHRTEIWGILPDKKRIPHTYKSPTTHKLINALMLQPILYTSACPKPLKRCDAPTSMKLQSNSPYHPAEKQMRHASENKTFFQQKMD